MEAFSSDTQVERLVAVVVVFLCLPSGEVNRPQYPSSAQSDSEPSLINGRYSLGLC